MVDLPRSVAAQRCGLPRPTAVYFCVIVTALAFAVFLSGCAHDARLQVLGELDAVQAETVQLVTANGMVTADAVLRNTSKRSRTVLYRFHWFDAKGRQLASEEPWKPLFLSGMQETQVRGQGPSTKAAEAKLEVYEDGAN